MAPEQDAGWDDLHRAFREATHAIQDLPDEQQAYESATQLADKLRELADQAARFRAASAARVKEAEGLTLGQLAARLGVSKQRAGQFVQVARADQGRSAEAGDTPPT